MSGPEITTTTSDAAAMTTSRRTDAVPTGPANVLARPTQLQAPTARTPEPGLPRTRTAAIRSSSSDAKTASKSNSAHPKARRAAMSSRRPRPSRAIEIQRNQVSATKLCALWIQFRAYASRDDSGTRPLFSVRVASRCLDAHPHSVPYYLPLLMLAFIICPPPRSSTCGVDASYGACSDVAARRCFRPASR